MVACFDKMKTREVSINLPFGIGGVTLAPNDAEKRAAWILCVYERSWDYFQQVLIELEALQEDMRQYVTVLGDIAGVS